MRLAPQRVAPRELVAPRGKLLPSDHLRLQYFDKLGEIMVIELKLATLIEPWWRWTAMLHLAMVVMTPSGRVRLYI